MRHLPWLVLLLSIGGQQAIAQAEPSTGGATASTAADTAAGGSAWSPQACGAEPARPVLDLSDRAKYNRSADVVSDYEAKAKTWGACVMKQARADMQAISAAAGSRMTGIDREATQIQARVYAGFGDYAAQFKTAQERFEKQK